jgi:dTDP-4-amino-4,6-dideoxygalactose transaminase
LSCGAECCSGEHSEKCAFFKYPFRFTDRGLLACQDDPDEVVKMLNEQGVDAYRGATQLNVVEPDNGHHDHVLSPLSNLDQFLTRYPHEAKYLIDHVVYLPVNRTVPFHELDRICNALSTALSSPVGTAADEVNTRETRVKLQSKL